MHELDILVGQIQRKQEYESMGMVQALKTMAEKKANDKINKAYEKEKRKYVIFTINWILFTNISILKLIYAFCIYITMFCNVFSKLFGKKEKKDSKNDKKTLENV